MGVVHLGIERITVMPGFYSELFLDYQNLSRTNGWMLYAVLPLSPYSQLLDKAAIAFEILFLQIVEKPPPLAYQL